MPQESIIVDLFDPRLDANKKFARLFDDVSWRKLITEASDESNDKELDVLLKELIEGH